MRPLVIFTGQGIARADGFNLTRRAKALPPIQGLADRLRQSDRQNLDALLELAVQEGSIPSAQLVSSIRALCLKERRSTLNKQAHHDVLMAVAEAAQDRLVLHLTASLDGLTTTFLVRDFGARWAPFHGPCPFEAVETAVRETLQAGRGLLHFPLHGEIGLYVCGREKQQLTTAYHHPTPGGDGETWTSTLIEGPGQGLRDVETRISTSRLALELLETLLRGERTSLDDARTPFERLPADLLAVGYGAGQQGARAENPFERTIARLAREDRSRSTARWRALLYRPEESRRTSRWYESAGFRVAGYDDGGLAHVVRDQLLATRRDERARQGRRPDPRLHARA